MISTVIPVYKNTALFLKNLRHNLSFMKNTEIIVVNDDPEVNLTKRVKKICPKAIVINNPKNLGFGPSVNLGVKKATFDYLLFLNSDVLLNGPVEKALEEFRDQKLFGLSFAQINNNGEISVANQGKFIDGIFQHSAKKATKKTTTLWPDGGSCLLRRSYFNKLNGFDPCFAPFYWEDVDLGFRAAQEGYQVLFYPQIKVKHEHATTINKYYKKEVTQAINYRNQLLFTWKNMRGLTLFKHIVFLPILALKLRRDKSFRQGLGMAVKKALGGCA
jgi:GT2 family glycosyltransferase